MRRSAMLARSATAIARKSIVATRRAVEVPVGLHAPVVGDRRGCRSRREFLLGDARRRARACPAPPRRPAARSAASTRPAPACPQARGGSRRSGCPEHPRECCARRPAARAAGAALQVRGEHAVGPEQAFDAHRGRDVRGGEQLSRSAMERISIPSIPSVPLISASPSFSWSVIGSTPPRRPGAPRARRAPALPHQRERTVGQRREVPRAAQRAVLADDRRHVVVESAA